MEGNKMDSGVQKALMKFAMQKMQAIEKERQRNPAAENASTSALARRGDDSVDSTSRFIDNIKDQTNTLQYIEQMDPKEKKSMFSAIIQSRIAKEMKEGLNKMNEFDKKKTLEQLPDGQEIQENGKRKANLEKKSIQIKIFSKDLPETNVNKNKQVADDIAVKDEEKLTSSSSSDDEEETIENKHLLPWREVPEEGELTPSSISDIDLQPGTIATEKTDEKDSKKHREKKKKKHKHKHKHKKGKHKKQKHKSKEKSVGKTDNQQESKKHKTDADIDEKGLLDISDTKKDNIRHRKSQKNKESDKYKESDKNNKSRDKESDRHKSDKHRESHKHRESDKHTESNRHKHDKYKESDKRKESDQHKESDRRKHKYKESDEYKESDKHKESNRHKEDDKRKEIDIHIERDKHIEIDRHIESEKCKLKDSIRLQETHKEKYKIEESYKNTKHIEESRNYENKESDTQMEIEGSESIENVGKSTEINVNENMEYVENKNKEDEQMHTIDKDKLVTISASSKEDSMKEKIAEENLKSQDISTEIISEKLDINVQHVEILKEKTFQEVTQRKEDEQTDQKQQEMELEEKEITERHKEEVKEKQKEEIDFESSKDICVNTGVLESKNDKVVPTEKTQLVKKSNDNKQLEPMEVEKEEKLQSHSKSKKRKRDKEEKEEGEISEKHKKRSRDEDRKRRDSRRSRSRSKSRSRRHRRSRSRSPSHRSHTSEKYRRRSRSPSRNRRDSYKTKTSRMYSDGRERSRSPAERIDKAKLLEIAKANAYAQMKAGLLPANLKLPPLSKEDKASQRAGGQTITELTAVCQAIQKKGEGDDPDDDSPINKPIDSDDEESQTFINHPFKLKPQIQSIVVNIKNAVQRPANVDKDKLRIQFPVSSGSQHRKKEEEVSPYGAWVPYQKPTTEQAVVTQATTTETTEIPTMVTGGQLSFPTNQATTSVLTTAVTPITAPVPTQVDPKDRVFEESTAPAVDIATMVSARLKAARALESNPLDVEALGQLHKAQKGIQSWANVSNKPGQFTGSTGVQILNAKELANSNPKAQAWAKKDMFLKSAPVSSGIGMMMLQKMGWRQGEGLGKNKEGSKEPLLLEIKSDRKGLVSATESHRGKPPVARVVTHDLTSKHPVSALMEICNKRKWRPPTFELIHDSGPSHQKNFVFKVFINNETYQPTIASSNKKQAKAQAATVALQKMGLIPMDYVHKES